MSFFSFLHLERATTKKNLLFLLFVLRRYRIMIKNWWACFLYPVSHLIGNIYSRRVIFVFSFVCGGGIERLVSRFSFFDFSCWCTNDSLKVFIVFIWWCSQRMYDFVFSYCSLSHDQFNLAFVHHQPALLLATQQQLASPATKPILHQYYVCFFLILSICWL